MSRIIDALQVVGGEGAIRITIQEEHFWIGPGEALYEAIIEEMQAEPRPLPMGAQTGQRRRFSSPINANKTGSGKIEADYGEYTAIEQRILAATNNKAMAQGNRQMLNTDRVFVIERGQQNTYPSPAHLYDESALFREFVDQCILWQQQNAQNSSSRVSVAAIVKTIVNYVRPKSGWLAWQKARLSGNDPLPVEDQRPARIEVIRPRGST